MHVEFVSVTGGVWNVNPASITVVKELHRWPVWSTEQDLEKVLASDMPQWIRRAAEHVADLLHKFSFE